MLRSLVIACLAGGILAVPALAGPRTQLVPGVVYERQVQFTRHGPVVLHVVTAPRPGGLYELRPALSNGAIVGLEKLSSIQRRLAPTTTTVGVSGDESPTGVLIESGVLHSLPLPGRSSIGIDAQGVLNVNRIGFSATWNGTGPRRPIVALNQPPGPNGVSLFTSAYGPSTPAAPDTVEAVFGALPPVRANLDHSGQVTEVAQGGSRRIPPGGAVLVGRGTQAPRIAAEAAVGATVVVRVLLSRPEWGAMVHAIGGGPTLVRGSRPVFRPYEDFSSDMLVPRMARSAVGQRADGTLLLVTVDGRQPGYSTGLTNFELAQAMARLRAVTAAGLSWGRSAVMGFEGELLSKPSDRAGERPVADALLLHYSGTAARKLGHSTGTSPRPRE